MKTVKLNITFTDDDAELGMVGKKILAALEKAKVKVTKFRYTYVETKDGMADMPPALILASFLSDLCDCHPFSHILPTLSGTYTLKFKR